MAVVSLSQAYVRYVDSCSSVSGSVAPILGLSQWLGFSAGDLVGDPSLVRRANDVLGMLQGVVPVGFGCASARGGELGVYSDVTYLEDFPKCSFDRDGGSERVDRSEQLAAVAGEIVVENVAGDNVVSNSSNSNKKKNLRKRRNKKLKAKCNQGIAVVDCDVMKTVGENTTDVVDDVRKRGGAFDACGDAVRRELQESRAVMLIAENRVKTAKAESLARHLELVKKSRVNETKFELDRQTVEEKLQKLSARRLGFVDAKGMPTGKVETVVSDTGLGSYATPSLTSGSVSPDSSISMQEVNEMKALIEKLSLEVRQLKSKLDSGERLIAQEDFDDYYVDDSLDQYAVGVDVQHRRAAFAEQKKIMSEYTVPRVEKSAVVLDLKPGVELLPGEDIDGMVKRVMKERGFENMEISF